MVILNCASKKATQKNAKVFGPDTNVPAQNQAQPNTLVVKIGEQNEL